MAINIWYRVNGTVTGSPANYDGGFEWRIVSQSEATNSSIVEFRQFVRRLTPTGGMWNLYTNTSYYDIDGTRYNFASRIDTREAVQNAYNYMEADGYTAVFPKCATKTVQITHLADGTRTVPVKTYLYGGVAGSIENITTTTTITLDAINAVNVETPSSTVMKVFRLQSSVKNFVETLTRPIDVKIESELELDKKTLTFKVEDIYNIKEEDYINFYGDEWIVKEMVRNGQVFDIIAVNNIEKIEHTPFASFKQENKTLKEVLDYLFSFLSVTEYGIAGWTYEFGPSLDITDPGSPYYAEALVVRTYHRNIDVKRKMGIDVIKEIKDTWFLEVEFDTLAKKAIFHIKRGEDKGAYFTSQLNLRQINQRSDTNEFITRLIPIGKDDLTIASVNGGSVVLDNFQYSEKVLAAYWIDTNYTTAQSLKDDGIKKLAELSKPLVSYSCDIIDLRAIYPMLSYNIGDSVTIIDTTLNIRTGQRIIKMIVYPFNPEANTVEMANKLLKFTDIQNDVLKSSLALQQITLPDGSVAGNNVVDTDGTTYNEATRTLVTAVTDESQLGQSQVGIIFSNENVSIGATASNVVVYDTDIYTSIQVLRGASFSEATIGTVKFYDTDDVEIAITPVLTREHPTASAAGSLNILVASGTNMTDANGYVKVEIIINGISYFKKINWSLVVGVVGLDGISANLTNDNISITTLPDGSNGDYSSANTIMQVFVGTIDDTANWTFTAVKSAGVTGAFDAVILNKYQITALSTDNGYVDITASQTDYPSITKRFSISKSKNGVPGTNGLPAVNGELTAYAAVLTADVNGVVTVFTPAQTTMSVLIGGADDSLNWTYATSAVNCTISGTNTRTVALTAISADNAYVDITASKSGFASITKRFLISKSKTGSTGTPGTNGTNGKTYVANITGGVRTVTFDANGSNPTPAQTAFGVELYENGSLVTPTYAWSATGHLSGTSSVSTFTPVMAGTFNATFNDTVSVTLVYAGQTVKVTIPVAVTKVGNTGAQGTPGTNGKTYVANITGGIRTVTFDANGANPTPAQTAFGVELYENGTLVTPATYAWSATGHLSGTASTATFTPTMAGTFNASNNDTVALTVTYSGQTIKVSVPTAVTKIGSTGATGTPGVDGDDAQYVVVNGEQAFKYLAGSATPTVTTITLTASLFGGLTAYDWEYWNGSAWTNLSGTQNTQTYALAYNNAAWTTASLRVRCLSGSVYDEITIVKLYDGNNGTDGTDGTNGTNGVNAVSGYLTNETVSLPTTSNGTGYVLTSAGGTFKVYNGTTDVTTSATFSGGATKNGLTLAIGAATGVYTLSGASWTTDSETFTLTAVYGGVTLTKVYTITKAKAGTNGSNGTNGLNAKAVNLATTSYVIQYAADGSTPSPSGTLVITATSQNFVDGYFKFTGDGITPDATYLDGATANTATKTFTIPSTYFATPMTVRVGVAEASQVEVAYDTITITAVKPGSNGSNGTNGVDALTVVNTNEAHTLPKTTAGVITYTGSGTILRLYEGATELLYDGVGTANSSWKVVATPTNITVGTLTDSGNYLTVGDHSAMTQNTASISYAITGKRASGTAFSITVTQSFSTAQQGATGSTGADGVPAKYVVVNGEQVFTFGGDGPTAQNLVTNGDFSNGTTGWVSSFGTLSAISNELVLTLTSLPGDGSTLLGTASPKPILAVTIGNKYYMAMEVYPKYAGTTRFGLGGVYPFLVNSIANVWNRRSTIITPVSASQEFDFMTNINLAGYVIGDTVKFRNMFLVNLTTIFGAGNEPTASQMDALLSGYANRWFDGSGQLYKVPTPATITLTAALFGGITGYDWEYWNGSAWANLSGTQNTSTYAISYGASEFGTSNYLRVRCQSSTGEYSEAEVVRMFNGMIGPGIVFRGAYNAATMYYYTSTRRDIVIYNGAYYMASDTTKSGLTTWGTPGASADWASFGAQFSSVATDILLAQDAYIKKTLVVGTNVSDNANILINGGSTNPYIALAQTTPGFSDDTGAYFGVDNGVAKLNLSGKLKWDGTNLIIDSSASVGTDTSLAQMVSNDIQFVERISSAEQKITPQAITLTVESTTTTLAKKDYVDDTADASSAAAASQIRDEYGQTITNVKSNFVFADNGLTISKSGSKFAVTISNTEMGFYNDSTKTAYVSGSDFHIDKGVIDTSLTIGAHKIEKYNSGVTIFRFVG